MHSPTPTTVPLRLKRAASVLLVVLVAVLVWCSVHAKETASPAKSGDGIRPATDAPKPLSPEDSRATIRLPKDLRIDLVACEPLIKEPSAMAFDERGRLFVCEIHGYNLDGYLDIVELNKT